MRGENNQTLPDGQPPLICPFCGSMKEWRVIVWADDVHRPGYWKEKYGWLCMRCDGKDQNKPYQVTGNLT